MNDEATTYRQKLSELRCVVVIPTYNNAETLAAVVADVKQYASDIIVVNDGSTDRTANVLSSIEGVTIITYPKNRGKGYALKLGLKRAHDLGFRYAITIDSDGQHYADDIPLFIDRIEQSPDILLIGARNLTAENMPSKNTFANKFSNFWFRVETGQKLADTQSGYRLYPLDKLQGLKMITSRYEFEVEIIVRAAWRGVSVENVPIKVYYAPAEERVSHFRPLRDFTRISILNTFLVICALLFYYPWKFLRALTWTNIKKFINTQIIHSSDSNLRMATAMGWGIFCGIIPIWGYQMIFAGLSAHFLKLNKVVAVVFSNISIPPMIPFILYGSMMLGSWALNIENRFSLSNISLETITLGLGQYLIGSVILALISGLVVFLISLLLMSVFKRKGGK